MSPLLARSAASNRAEQCPLCPDTSDFDLFGNGKRVIDLDTEPNFPFSCVQASWTARRLPVRRQISVAFVRRSECVPKICGSSPMPAIHSETRRAYCRVVMAPPGRLHLVNRNP